MVAIKSKSIDEISAMAEQRLPVPGADVAWLVKRVRELEEALKPFSDMAGELFARNWNKGDVVIALDNPDDPHRVMADDFFQARVLLCFTPEDLARADQEDAV